MITTSSARVPVQVKLFQGGRGVASEYVMSGSSYDFEVSSGTYAVSSSGRPRHVTVTPGETVEADFDDVC